jgi:hypothetical protein
LIPLAMVETGKNRRAKRDQQSAYD